MRTDHKTKGLKRLAIEFTSKNMLAKAAREFPGESAMTGVARLLPELGQHMREGMERAKAAVEALKSAPDFDPEIHGRTDDDIADELCAAIKAQREAVQ